MQILLIVVVLLLLSGRMGSSSAPPRVPPFKAPPPPTPGDYLIAGASRVTGVPLDQVGAAASKAPAWVKAAEFPVLVTGETYDAIRHPVDTVEKAWNTTTHAIEHPVDTAKSAWNTVKGWF